MFIIYYKSKHTHKKEGEGKGEKRTGRIDWNIAGFSTNTKNKVWTWYKYLMGRPKGISQQPGNNTLQCPICRAIEK